MYGLMVAFEPTRVVPVARGFNDGLNFGNVTTENEEGGADGNKNREEARVLSLWGRSPEK